MLNAIHGVSPRPTLPHTEELGKYEQDNSGWTYAVNKVAYPEQSLGSSPWMNSNQALLGPTPAFAVHDEGPRSSISVSVISMQDEAPTSSRPALEPTSPAISTSNHFGLSKGSPIEARNSFFLASMPQLQRMDFPDPVKRESLMHTSEYDRKISPSSLSQRPFSESSTPNFSRPSSRGGDPHILLPDHTEFYRQLTQSQRPPAQSSILSDYSESGRLPNGRPKTRDLGRPEDLTALPPILPLKDLRKSQIGWI